MQESSDSWTWLPWGVRKRSHALLEKRDAARRRHHFDASLDEHEPAYRRCMQKIVDFHRTHGDDAARVFAEDAPDTDASEIDRCRSVAKDYFRTARHMVADERCVDDPDRLARLRRQHVQFVRYVKPLDDTQERHPTEGATFGPFLRDVGPCGV